MDSWLPFRFVFGHGFLLKPAYRDKPFLDNGLKRTPTGLDRINTSGMGLGDPLPITWPIGERNETATSPPASSILSPRPRQCISS